MNERLRHIATALEARRWHLATAESCTGGLIAATITSMAGSSAWYDCGFVTYQSRSKVDLLGVKAETIARHTVVSEPVAREMAIGALLRSHADVAVSVTCIAGPGGGDVASPVGTAWLGWAIRDPEPVCVQASRFDFSGDRDAVRHAAVDAAIEGVASILFDLLE